MFETGLGIHFDEQMCEFIYPSNVFGPPHVEKRYLKDIIHSLADSKATGPKIVYSIAMDIGLGNDRIDLLERELLFGTVAYAAGSIGEEPVKSQGHIHSISKTCQMSTPEVYEIWSGEAIIYMQEKATNDPGRCYAVQAKAGEVIIVPPAWAHCTINASKTEKMVFGAWCVRDFGFEYDAVRAHKGLAFYPKFDARDKIVWEKNPNYQSNKLVEKSPREYTEFRLDSKLSIYQQYKQDKSKFDFVVRPDLCKEKWENYVP
ncbi:MAG: glucose-6-phosphate isomerase family protein [Enterococcus sp.]|uniref:glucose-6-phosphate isomerase family protein n=1 Tax=Enterococcus sp. TaxID=35783 RepID=UPI002FCA2CF9